MSLLLIGGIVVIGLGVVGGIAALVIALVRRGRRSGGAAAAPTTGAQLAETSPFTAYQVPGVESESNSISAAFVAGPRREAPAGESGSGLSEGAAGGAAGSGSASWSLAGASNSEVSSSGAQSSDGPPLAPTVPAAGVPTAEAPTAAPAIPAWQDIVGSADDPEPFGYTTGSFAVPSPLANPWDGEAVEPQVPAAAEAPAARGVPAAFVPAVDEAPAAPEAAAQPASPPETAIMPTRVPDPDPEAKVPAAPEAPAAFLPAAAAPEPGEDESTVLIAGRGQGPAPWLLILDTGDRIGIEADSVVLGRRPAAIEHGVPGVTVPDPTKTLSKVHARLDLVDEQWTITDLDSTNGTAIIEPGGRERLLERGGSETVRGRFVLGEVGLVLVRNPEALPGPRMQHSPESLR